MFDWAVLEIPILTDEGLRLAGRFWILVPLVPLVALKGCEWLGDDVGDSD
jgi:hypothetical protein